MNYEILCSICCFINLNKVISASKCSKRPCKSLCIFQLPVASKLCQIKFLLPSFPHFTSWWNKMCCLIHFLKINLIFSKIYRIHPASDIHSDHIRHCLVCYGHCCSYRTPLTGMHIRHDTDLGTFCHCIITHASDLLYSLILYYFCIAESRIYFSLNL